MSLNAKFKFFSPSYHLEFVINTADVPLSLQGGSEWKKMTLQGVSKCKNQNFSPSNHLEFVISIPDVSLNLQGGSE